MSMKKLKGLKSRVTFPLTSFPGGEQKTKDLKSRGTIPLTCFKLNA